MKPLNDRQLKKLFSQKLTESEPLDSEHMWEGIESSLPPETSTNVLVSVAKVVSVVGILSVVFFTSKTEATNPHLVEEVNSEKSEIEVGSEPDVEEALLVTNESTVSRQRVLLKNKEKQTIQESITTISPETTSATTFMNSTAHVVEDIETTPTFHEEDPVIINAPTKKVDQRFLTSISVGIQLAETDSSELYPIMIVQQPRVKATSYWSIYPYLSFHTLDPSRLDEYLVTGDPDQKPEPLDRVGVNIHVGRSRQIADRLSLKYSAGIDYYKTKFHFQVVNSGDPSVTIQNHRLDLGLHVGFDYRHRGIISVGTLGAEVGGRTRLMDFSNSELKSYSSTIVTYRFTYLVDAGLWKIGPSYTSFLTAKDFTGFGKINPTIYGFMFRREI